MHVRAPLGAAFARYDTSSNRLRDVPSAMQRPQVFGATGDDPSHFSPPSPPPILRNLVGRRAEDLLPAQSR